MAIRAPDGANNDNRKMSEIKKNNDNGGCQKIKCPPCHSWADQGSTCVAQKICLFLSVLIMNIAI